MLLFSVRREDYSCDRTLLPLIASKYGLGQGSCGAKLILDCEALSFTLFLAGFLAN